MANFTTALGACLRDIAYYGNQNASFPPFSDPSFVATQLDALHSLGVEFVRFYVSNTPPDSKPFSTADCIAAVRTIVNEIHNRGMQAIICLDDSISSGYQFNGASQFHKVGSFLHLNGDYWANQQNYKPYLTHIGLVADAFKDSPAVAVFELGNEYGLYAPENRTLPYWENFACFVADATEVLKNHAPNKLVSTGLISTWHAFRDPIAGESDADFVKAQEVFFQNLYSPVDLVCVHYYRERNEQDSTRGVALRDLKFAQSMGKPAYVGELGMVRTLGDRKDWLSTELANLNSDDLGIRLVLLWSFNAVQSVALSDEHGISAHWDEHTDPGRGYQNDYREITDWISGVQHSPNVLRGVDKVFPVVPRPTSHLTYKQDITIPDNTTFTPGASMGDKVWRVQNGGQTVWGPGFVLKHDAGPDFGAPTSIVLPNLAPGEEQNITLAQLTAPQELGRQLSSWVPYDAEGKRFGSNLTIDINLDINVVSA